MQDAIARLMQEKRCIPGIEETNYVGGLIDLIKEAKPANVLEIGANRGVSTECFLLLCEQVTVIDSWEGMWAESYHDFMQRCRFYRNLKVIRGRSPYAVSFFPSHCFDLVYVDADHDEASAVKDIAAAMRVTRRWLAGHDYIQPGVRTAINALLPGQKIRTFSDTSWLIDMLELWLPTQ